MLYDFIVAHRRRPCKGRAKSSLFVKVALSIGRQFIFSHGRRFLRQGRASQKGPARAAKTKVRRTISGPAPPPAGGKAGPTADIGLSAAGRSWAAPTDSSSPPSTAAPLLRDRAPWPSPLPSRTSERRKITPQSALPSHTVLFFCPFGTCCAYKSILLLYHSTIF